MIKLGHQPRLAQGADAVRRNAAETVPFQRFRDAMPLEQFFPRAVVDAHQIVRPPRAESCLSGTALSSAA